jgi:hypothetical protein
MSAPLGGMWRKFLDLLPQSPRQVGTITALTGDGSYTAVLTGGGTLQVLGAAGYSVGSQIFIKDGKIESKAPTLTSIVIEV